MTAPVFCSFLYASRNPHASMVQPGVSALGKKNSTTVLPRKSFSDTCSPFWSGKLKSGAFSLASMFSPTRPAGSTPQSLYRIARRTVICLAIVFGSLAVPVLAQFGRTAQQSKGPRAIALVQFTGGSARLLPIAIMVNGKFYDAGLYHADPRPMALEPGVVYEAQHSGVPAGLFTVGPAEQINGVWDARGEWEPAGAAQAAKAAKVEAPKRRDDEDKPPVLRRPGSSPPQAANPSPEKPAPAPATPPTPSASPAPNSQPASSTSTEDDPNRPVLRRGKQPIVSEKPSSETKLSGTAAPAAAANSATKDTAPAPRSAPKPQLLPAISDAGGPESRSFLWQLKPGEERDFTKKMQGFAQSEVVKYEKLRMPNFVSAQLTPGAFHVFDVDLSNQPVFIYMTTANLFTGSAGASSRTRQRPAPGTDSGVQAYITIVGKMDLYGELRQIFSSVTDSRHADEIPRLELIDAVDADGDGRGELLFHEISDAGAGYAIYRVTPDRLIKLYDSAGPVD